MFLVIHSKLVWNFKQSALRKMKNSKWIKYRLYYKMYDNKTNCLIVNARYYSNGSIATLRSFKLGQFNKFHKIHTTKIPSSTCYFSIILHLPFSIFKPTHPPHYPKWKLGNATYIKPMFVRCSTYANIA